MTTAFDVLIYIDDGEKTAFHHIAICKLNPTDQTNCFVQLAADTSAIVRGQAGKWDLYTPTEPLDKMTRAEIRAFAKAERDREREALHFAKRPAELDPVPTQHCDIQACIEGHRVIAVFAKPLESIAEDLYSRDAVAAAAGKNRQSPSTGAQSSSAVKLSALGDSLSSRVKLANAGW
ncbi:hypothetical protein BOTBODRAFT_60051 [Botryobasidium botryosum FD-172 SS1]|uniref:Uncharacterized protein n=1 Tax=Botryobasidium botryosum (strain FD-172 SS1) TaxID=930990 RepID=A0A067M6A2_BOTB1|nr:hypothetical protein BOTBODRAFT_60051 [Botryobasidium botryosum FD-172 SS1]